MKPPGGHRRRPPRKVQNEDPATLLHRYAVSLFDKGDGRAIDWPRAAIALFTAGLTCIDETRDTKDGQTVLRRVHDAAYTRLAGSQDSGTPFAPDRPEAPPLTPGAVPHSDLDFHH